MAKSKQKFFKKYEEKLNESFEKGLDEFSTFLYDCGYNLTKEEKGIILDEEVSFDLENGLKTLALASASGNTDALVKLGELYANGTNVEKDLQMAYWCFKVAASKNNVEGMIKLADALKHGKGHLKDLDESFKLYSDATNLGSTKAKYELAKFYVDGTKPVKKDKIHAVELLYDVVARENEYANSVADPYCLNEVTTELGWNAQRGIDYIIINIKKSDYKGETSDKIMDKIYSYYDPFRAISLSARLGLAGVVDLCGKTSDYLYHLEASMTDDWKFELLEEVGKYFANANLFLANERLELAFFNPDDKKFFDEMCEEALNYLKKPCVGRNSMLNVLKGDIYLNGLGVKPNFFEAFRLYDLAKVYDSEFAKFKLAKMYYYGLFFNKNVLTALSYIYDLDYAKVDKYKTVYGPGISSASDFDDFINKKTIDEELAKLTLLDVNKENIKFLEKLAKENEIAKRLLDQVDENNLTSNYKYVWPNIIPCELLLDYVTSENTISSRDICNVLGELNSFYEVEDFLKEHNITIDDSKDLKALQESLEIESLN